MILIYDHKRKQKNDLAMHARSQSTIVLLEWLLRIFILFVGSCRHVNNISAMAIAWWNWHLLYFMIYFICSTFGGDFNLAVWQFWLQSPNLMYTNTTYNYMYYEAMYTVYHLVHQTKISINARYVPIRQTYCSPCIW